MSNVLVSIESKYPTKGYVRDCIKSLYDSTELEFDLSLHSNNMEEFNFAKVHNDCIKPKLENYDYVLNINDDLVFKTDWLEESLRVMYNRRDCGIIGVKILNEDGTINHGGGSIGIKDDIIVTEHISRGDNEGLYRSVQGVSWVTGAYHFMRTEALKKVGLYDEGYGLTYEDTDLCLRMWENNYKVIYNPNIVIIHDEASTREIGNEVELEAHKRFNKKWENRFQGLIDKVGGVK